MCVFSHSCENTCWIVCVHSDFDCSTSLPTLFAPGSLRNSKVFEGRGHHLGIIMPQHPTYHIICVCGRQEWTGEGKEKWWAAGGMCQALIMAYSSFIPEKCCPSRWAFRRRDPALPVPAQPVLSLLCFPRVTPVTASILLPLEPWLLRVSRKEKKGKSPWGLQFLSLITHIRKDYAPQQALTKAL